MDVIHFTITTLSTSPQWWKNIVYKYSRSVESEFWQTVRKLLKEYDATIIWNKWATEVNIDFNDEQQFMLFVLKWG
jgi:siderophore synthetase component